MGGFALGYLPFLGAAAVVMASIAAKDIKEDPGLSLWQAKHAYASATSHLRKAISDHQSTLKQSASSDISYEICFCEDGSNMNARSRQQQQPNNLAERGSPLPEDTEGQMAADSKEAFAKADRQPAQHSAALKEADARAEAHATALVHADSSPSLKVPENSASDRAELQAVLEDKAELQAAVKDRAELQIVLKAVDDRAEQAEALDQQQQILIARLEDAEQLLKLLRGRAVEEHTALLEQQSRLEDAEKSFQVRMQEVERTAAARAEQAEAAVMKLRRQLEEVQQQLISQSQEAEEATRDRAEAQSLRRVLNAERQKFAKLRQLLKDRPAVPAQVSAETALPCPADSPNHHEVSCHAFRQVMQRAASTPHNKLQKSFANSTTNLLQNTTHAKLLCMHVLHPVYAINILSLQQLYPGLSGMHNPEC